MHTNNPFNLCNTDAAVLPRRRPPATPPPSHDAVGRRPPLCPHLAAVDLVQDLAAQVNFQKYCRLLFAESHACLQNIMCADAFMFRYLQERHLHRLRLVTSQDSKVRH
jgi:hypothetical protein